MCSHRVLSVLLLLPSLAAAQDADAWRDSTRRIAAEFRAERDSLDRASARLAMIAERDGLALSGTSKLGAGHPETLVRFDRARRRWFGADFPSPQGFRIVLRGVATGGPRQGLHGDVSLSLAGLPDTLGAQRIAPSAPSSVLNDQDRAVKEFLFYYGQMMLASAAEPVTRWLQGGLPLEISDEARQEQAMYALTTGVGAAQRACILGDVGECAYALGLGPSRHENPGGRYHPLARAHLLLAALDAGGEGAWRRLRGTHGVTAADYLGAAAAMPLDSLLSRWRRDLLALRPERSPVDPRDVVLLIVWSGVVMLGIAGATRWV